MHKNFKHPVFHILIFGLLAGIIFLVLFGPKMPSTEDRRIVIGNADLAHVLASWTRTWQRPPTKEELKGVLQKYVMDEVVYQEALNQNMDDNNAAVKRSLIMQMDMLAASQGGGSEISEDDISAYYSLRKDQFQKLPTFSFSQVYFKQNREEKSVRAAIDQLNLNKTIPSEVKNVGDPLMLASDYSLQSTQQIDNTLGAGFSDQLNDLPLDQWSGPIKSSYGWHAIYLSEQKPASALPLEKVRNEIVREMEYEGKEAAREQFYTELLQQYEIVYEGEVKVVLNEK